MRLWPAVKQCHSHTLTLGLPTGQRLSHSASQPSRCLETLPADPRTACGLSLAAKQLHHYFFKMKPHSPYKKRSHLLISSWSPIIAWIYLTCYARWDRVPQLPLFPCVPGVSATGRYDDLHWSADSTPPRCSSKRPQQRSEKWKDDETEVNK